jgi:hypothetical protein
MMDCSSKKKNIAITKLNQRSEGGGVKDYASRERNRSYPFR